MAAPSGGTRCAPSTSGCATDRVGPACPPPWRVRSLLRLPRRAPARAAPAPFSAAPDPARRVHHDDHAHGHSHGLLDDSIKRSRGGVRAVSLALLVLGAAAAGQVVVFA